MMLAIPITGKVTVGVSWSGLFEWIQFGRHDEIKFSFSTMSYSCATSDP